MACQGHIGDYLCQGWRIRAAAIRARDGDRCRGCDRDKDEIDLQVHHRRYGEPGQCGDCVLCGVSDEDLVTLCVECHDHITDIRRMARYAKRSPISIALVSPPPAVQAPIRLKAEVVVEMTPVPVRMEPAVRKSRVISVDFIGDPQGKG